NRQQTKKRLDRKSPIQVRIRLPPAASPLRTCRCTPSSVRRWLRLFCRKHAAMRIAAAGDRLLPSPRIASDQIMLKAQIAQAVQLFDLMLEYFADDGHWTRGRYDDGDGGHCLVGALLHLSREHRCQGHRQSRSCRMPCPGPVFRLCTSTTG